MKSHFKKASLVAMLAVAMPISSLLASCGANSQTQAQAPSPTMMDSGTMKGMDQGGMGHNMSMDLGPADANLDMRFIDAMTRNTNHFSSHFRFRICNQGFQCPHIGDKWRH